MMIKCVPNCNSIVTIIIGIPTALNFQKLILMPFAAAFSAMIMLHTEPNSIAFPANVDDAAKVYQKDSV